MCCLGKLDIYGTNWSACSYPPHMSNAQHKTSLYEHSKNGWHDEVLTNLSHGFKSRFYILGFCILPVLVDGVSKDSDDQDAEEDPDDDEGRSLGAVALAAVARQEVGPRHADDVMTVAADPGHLRYRPEINENGR